MTPFLPPERIAEIQKMVAAMRVFDNIACAVVLPVIDNLLRERDEWIEIGKLLSQDMHGHGPALFALRRLDDALSASGVKI